MAWDAVLIEQDEQEQFGYYDDEKISVLYQNVQKQFHGDVDVDTGQQHKVHLDRAKQDRKFADDYLMTPRTMKLMKKTTSIKTIDIVNAINMNNLNNLNLNVNLIGGQQQGQQLHEIINNNNNSTGNGNDHSAAVIDDNDNDKDNESAAVAVAVAGIKRSSHKRYMRRLSV